MTFYLVIPGQPILKARMRGSSAREQTTSYGAPQSGPTISLPTAEVGNPVPYFIGKQRIATPNVIEYANIKALTETVYTTQQTHETVIERQSVGTVTRNIESTITKTITVATTNVIGYTCDVLVALALGPGVRLTGIYSDENPIWTGDLGHGGSATIPAGDLFVSGATFTFHSGEFNQSPYVGIAYVTLQNLRADKPFTSLQFDITRYPNPLALTTAKNKMGDDVNVASAIVELITNPWGGVGVDISAIDTASFIAAANTLYDEGNKCSLLILDTYDAKSIIDILQKQANGLVIQNSATGKLEFNIMRNKAITLANTLQLNNSNIVDIRNLSKSGWQDTVEQLRGTYTDRAAGYAPVPLFAQNIANLSQSGRGKRTGTVDYPTVLDKNLAIKLISRDIARLSSPSYSFELTVDRTAAKAKPGDLAIVNYGKYKMFSVMALVNRVRKQPLNSNLVTLMLSQYPMTDETAVYLAPDDPDNTPDPTKPIKPTAMTFYIAPYWFARRINTAISSKTIDAGVFALMLPKPANNYQSSFASYISNVPGAAGDVQTGLNSPYSTFAELGSTINKADGIANGLIAEILIDSVINLSNLINIGSQGVIDGKLFVFIDNEILSFESFEQVTTNQWKLKNVRRALIDTVPQDHTIGTAVYIVGTDYSLVAARQFDYPLGYLPSWKIVSNTVIALGNKADALISTGFTPDFNRTIVPVRPHDTKIDGNRYYDGTYEIYAGATANVTWKTRLRSSLVIARQNDAAEAGEVDANSNYQIHRVKMRDAAGTVFDLGATDDDATYNTLAITIPPDAALGIAALWAQAETVNGISHYNDEINITIKPTFAILDETGTGFFTDETETKYLTLEGS